ncbi:MAG: DUF3187 family protein [Thiotrichales bacterium]
MVAVVAWSPLTRGEGWFPVHNHNPLVLTQVAPGSPADPSVAAGVWLARVHYSLSNTLNQESSAREALVFDGETEVLAVAVTRGLAGGGALWFQVPLIRHAGGGLDRLIDRYHDWLGLPAGKRPGWPRDRLRFEYERDGVTEVRLNDPTGGLGDVTLGISSGWRAGGSERGALYASMKLPSGNANRLTGSGGAAFGVGADLEWSLAERWRGRLQAGVTWLAPGDLLPQLQRRWAGAMGVGIGWRATPALDLRTQVDASTALYRDSRLRWLNEAVLLTAGAGIRLDPQWTLELAVTEDLLVDAAPDVTFQVGLSRRF